MMSLLYCPQCGHKQSNERFVCQHCKAPLFESESLESGDSTPFEQDETVRRAFDPSRVLLVENSNEVQTLKKEILAPNQHQSGHSEPDIPKIAHKETPNSSAQTAPLLSIASIQANEENFFLYKQIDDYFITEKIGTGGFGTVYAATHQNKKKIFALKLLHLGTNTSPEVIKRFQREAQTITQLKHKYIIQLEEHGFVKKHNIYYFAMELLKGASLREKLDQKFKFSIKQIMLLIEQLCEALVYVHKKNIYHRDIKPANIFLLTDQNGNQSIKLIDFGIASVQTNGTVLTKTGSFIGSPAYMSPEQARGEARQVDQRSDLYSLGLVLFELLTEKKPFAADSIHGMLFNHVYTPPPRLSELKPRKEWAPSLEAFIQRILAKERAARPEDTAIFWQECERALMAQSDLEDEDTVIHSSYTKQTADWEIPIENIKAHDSHIPTTDEHIIPAKTDEMEKPRGIENPQGTENLQGTEEEKELEGAEIEEDDTVLQAYHPQQQYHPHQTTPPPQSEMWKAILLGASISGLVFGVILLFIAWTQGFLDPLWK